MDIATYHAEVRRTSDPDFPYSEKMVLAGLGIAGEASEFAALVREIVTDEQYGVSPSNGQHDDLCEEAGDLLWYMAYLLNHFEMTFEVITASSLEAYQSFPFFRIEDESDIMATALELTIAAGAVADFVKKHILHQKPLDLTVLVGRLTIVFGNLTILLNHFDIKLGDALDKNTAKLRVRYPDGWSVAASLARADKQQNAE